MSLQRYKSLFFLLLLICPLLLQARVTESSAPYLSGDTFRAMCQFYFDEVTTSFAPEKVRPGDCIFVKTDLLDQFFQTKHPFIKNPYIIVSHNSDHPAPGPGLKYLDDPKIVAWFAQNVEYIHPKLLPIPIGIANKMWPHGNVSILEECRKKIPTAQRTKLMYLNFAIVNYPQERQKVWDYFVNNKYCLASPSKPFRDYLHDLLDVRFVISPRGNGLDCHRTWEALYMGAIPIVRESKMDAVYEGLPVIIVKNWEQVTLQFLKEKSDEIKKGTYSDKKLYSTYWKSLLFSYREKARKLAAAQKTAIKNIP